MISILICYNGWNGELPNNEVALQNQKRSILQTKFGMGLFFINELLCGGCIYSCKPFRSGSYTFTEF